MKYLQEKKYFGKWYRAEEVEQMEKIAANRAAALARRQANRQQKR
jgi:hypothetical protein